LRTGGTRVARHAVGVRADLRGAERNGRPDLQRVHARCVVLVHFCVHGASCVDARVVDNFVGDCALEHGSSHVDIDRLNGACLYQHGVDTAFNKTRSSVADFYSRQIPVLLRQFPEHQFSLDGAPANAFLLDGSNVTAGWFSFLILIFL
jgi:hypothetical protein